MPRTITLDGIQVLQVRLLRDVSGELYVFCEYDLTAGGQAMQTKHVEVTRRLSASRKAAALALLDVIEQDVTASELG